MNYDDLHIRTSPVFSEDIPYITSYVKAFESYTRHQVWHMCHIHVCDMYVIPVRMR